MKPTEARNIFRLRHDGEAASPSPHESAPGRWRWLALRGGVSAAVLLALSAGAIALADDRVAPLTDSPTSTELSQNAPLAEAFRDAYVGVTGVYDPQNGLVSPGETHFDIQVQAAHNGTEIFFRYDVPTPLASYYHDYVVYQDGEWIRAGRSAVGTEPHGLYEDRITMLVDDGSVRGFASAGGWLTCHEDLRAPFMFAGATDQEVKDHPVLGRIYGRDEARKYLPQSRDAGPEWWRFDGWGAMSEENVERYDATRAAGVFLDLWHWRAHRSDPVGYSDNEYVFESRRSDPGTGMFSNNWDDDATQPKFMFDPAASGRYALSWDVVQQQGYGFDDQFFLAEGVNTVPFDPNRAWQNGDTIPRRLLNPNPTDGRAAIKADAALVADGDAWRWQVELRRAMDTGSATDKAILTGRTYNAAVAAHRLAMGSRWHLVSLPFTIGVDVPATVTAARFEGETPDWSAIPPTTLTLIYPGQTSWEFITSDQHPGATAIRDSSMSVIGCHDVIGLAEANKALEPTLLGLSPGVPEVDGPLGGLLDPANATLIFLAVAVGTLGVAIGGGIYSGYVRRRRA